MDVTSGKAPWHSHSLLGGVGVFIIGVVVCAALSPLIPEVINPYLFSIVMYAGINITLAVSLNLVNGLTGQFSMGHAGFMAVGAYTSAFLTTTMLNSPSLTSLLAGSGLPPIVSQGLVFAGALYMGGLVAAMLGFVVDMPSLRLKGDYLAIVTLGFGEIIRVLILNINAIGGARGMSAKPLTSFGWVYAVAFICTLTVKRLMASSHGRALLAVREDEIAAESMGVNTTRYKVTAFVIGAFFAGVAGGLYAHFLTFISPQAFDFNKSFEIIIMVVLGGMGSTTGAIVAAIFLTGLKELLRPLQEITKLDFRMVIYSLMLIFLMLNRPNGLFGTKELVDFWIFRRFKRDPLKLADLPVEGGGHVS